MSHCRVAVLMSTYNGEQYIKEQIESIIHQQEVEISLFIRDDGSSDHTIDIINEYNDANIIVNIEENIGVKGSFAKLLLNVDNKFDYYAFADQDDIWDLDKIISAINKISELSTKYTSEVPILYFCNQRCIDRFANDLYIRFPNTNMQPDIMDTIFYNRYSGCTMVFNGFLLKYLKQTYSAAKGKYPLLHDIWTMSIAQLLGKVIYDEIPHMSFRRHGNNLTEEQDYKEMVIRKRINILLRKYNTFRRKFSERGEITWFLNLLLHELDEYICKEDKKRIVYFLEYKKSIFKWTNFIFHNELKSHFEKPRIFTYFKILWRFY